MTRISGLQNVRNMQAAVEAVGERSPGLKKPSLRRFTWSRLHTDLLDDFRWSLVAKRANAPLPLVEAVLIRLENHANRSHPRGYVGDFSAEGLAARWHVEADTIGRIYAQLEEPDIGWIDQDQIVTFWDRNPDKIDETAKDRQQRVRDRKKGYKQLAQQAAQCLITPQQRLEREIALKDSMEPKALMAAWAQLSTGPGRHDASRRDSVTVTPRADQNINQDAREKVETGAVASGRENRQSGEIVNIGEAELWIAIDGRRIITERMRITTQLAETTLARWRRELDDDVVILASIIQAAAATSLISAQFHVLISEQIKRRQQEAKGPALPLPPVSLRRSTGNV